VMRKLAADRRLQVDAYDRSDQVKLASGTLLTGDNQIDTSTGTEKLKAVFENRDQSLFPNQFVNIHLDLEDRTNALVIPSAAIQSGIQGSFVWVIDSSAAGGAATARVQPVKVALTEGSVSILDSGLQPGQNIVIDGADRLRAGQAVIATAATARGAQAPAAAPQAPPSPAGSAK